VIQSEYEKELRKFAVAADVRRRIHSSPLNPPPHVGGYVELV